MKKADWIILIITGIILAVVLNNDARADYEISAGNSIFSKQPDGTWYQEPFAHSINLQSKSVAIGITDYISTNVRYHIGYEYLGGVSSVALAVANDNTYAQYGANAYKHLTLGTWYGSGNVQMIYAILAPEIKRGNWTLAIEPGLSIYRPTWTEQVINYQTGSGAPIISNTFHHKARLEICESLGVSLGYKNTSAVLTFYPGINAAGDEFPAIYKGLVTNFSIRYRF